MKTKSVPYLSKDQIESDANALLTEFARARGVMIRPPIPVEDIIEKYLKLHIDFDNMHSLLNVERSGTEPDILGAMFFEDSRIVIDETLDPVENPASEGRYRFTLAHEGGGHWRLHRDIFCRNRDQLSLSDTPDSPAVVCRTSQAKERVEWQADYYASCLLMPRQLIFSAWQRQFGGLKPFVFGKSTPMPKSNSAWNGLRSMRAIMKDLFQDECDAQFEQVARRFNKIFGVSRDAMQFRLQGLGLLLPSATSQSIFANCS